MNLKYTRPFSLTAVLPLIFIVMLAVITRLAPKKGDSPSSPASPQVANPASVNCTEKGGRPTTEKRVDGSEYGVCHFTDGKQCEEWALFRDECPVGGVKVTGYDKPEQVFCIITGGQTAAQEGSNCTLFDGRVCSNSAYYEGQCPQNP